MDPELQQVPGLEDFASAGVMPAFTTVRQLPEAHAHQTAIWAHALGGQHMLRVQVDKTEAMYRTSTPMFNTPAIPLQVPLSQWAREFDQSTRLTEKKWTTSVFTTTKGMVHIDQVVKELCADAAKGLSYSPQEVDELIDCLAEQAMHPLVHYVRLSAARVVELRDKEGPEQLKICRSTSQG
jgi:hypothetical protein